MTKLREVTPSDHSTPLLDDIKAWGATVSIPKACEAIGVCQSHGYAMAARGAFPARVIKVGGRYRVVTASLVRLLEGDEPPLDAA